MAIKSKQDLKTWIDTYLNTNGISSITGEELNTGLTDYLDSLDRSYEGTFSTVSLDGSYIYRCVHGLDTEYPIVTLWDGDGVQTNSVLVKYINENTVDIYCNGSIDGTWKIKIKA